MCVYQSPMNNILLKIQTVECKADNQESEWDMRENSDQIEVLDGVLSVATTQ